MAGDLPRRSRTTPQLRSCSRGVWAAVSRFSGVRLRNAGASQDFGCGARGLHHWSS